MVVGMHLPTLALAALDREWSVIGSSRSSRSAMADWVREDHGLFDGLRSPADVVAFSHARIDPDRTRRLQRVVLSRADTDRLAARTMLQAVMPGLAGVALELRRTNPGRCQVLWRGDRDEMIREALSLAAERIAMLATMPPAWPAQQIVDQVRRRLRVQFDCHDRDARRLAPLEDGEDCEAGSARTAAELIGSTVCAAVDGGVLNERDGTVLYGLEVLGFTHAELADRLGCTSVATRQVRHRGGVALARAMTSSTSALRFAA